MVPSTHFNRTEAEGEGARRQRCSKEHLKRWERKKKNPPLERGGETRQIGGWQMGGSLQPSSPRRRVQKQKMWEVEEKEKKRGIKRWMEIKDGQQMDSGDARQAPSTRN